MKRTASGSCLLLTLALGVAAGAAQDFKGADAALRQLAPREVGPDGKPERAGTAGDLERDLEQFRLQAPSMPPAEAARAWLALADRYFALAPQELAIGASVGEPLTFAAVVAALPPPPAWGALAGLVDGRRPADAKLKVKDVALSLLVHMLEDNRAAQWRDLAALHALVKKLPGDNQQYVMEHVSTLSDAFARQSGKPDRIL